MSNSTSEARFQQIQANYQQALDNELDDLARAMTADELSAVQANLAQATAVFFKTAADQLAAQGEQVEEAFNAAVAANKSVEEARARSASIAELAGALSEATQASEALAKHGEAV